ncbi:hypothetical protein H5410_060972, partial [Solanum commersonii]
MENTFDFKNHVSLEFNKLRGYPNNNSGNTKFAHKPSMQTYYYSRPTPQDVLIEKRDWNQTNTSYSGSEIYEWNLNGLTDRQLTILHINMNACNTCQGDICSCENDEFYKLQSQFEDLNINTITSDNVIELLKEVTDNNLRDFFFQLAVTNNASSSKNSEKQKNDFEYEYSSPYSLSEINNRLNKQTISTRDSSFDDLKNEIENLKNEIKSIKQNQMICDHRLTQIETINNKGKNIAEENTLAKPFNLDPRQGIINAKGFLATYEDRNISYTFITNPISRWTLPWVTKARGKGNYRGRGRSSPGSSGSSYRSSSSSPIIQRGMSLIKSRISQKEASSSIHLEDIPENNPLYAQIHAYLSQKQSDTFASITKEDIDDIKSYEKLSNKEMIFLSENTNIQQKEEPWKISQRYLVKELYFPERHKHTWFIKICAKIFAEPIPNWFLNWWSYHGPTINILPNPFLKLYKEWVKVFPDLNELYNADHICYLEIIEQIYFFIEFFIPWIHKWTPEVGFTKEQIPCLYRIFYNNLVEFTIEV